MEELKNESGVGNNDGTEYFDEAVKVDGEADVTGGATGGETIGGPDNSTSPEEQKKNKSKKKIYIVCCSIIVAIILLCQFIPEEKIKTTCYLNETCKGGSIEITISAASYNDYYLTERGQTYDENIICLYGVIYNTLNSELSMKDGWFQLELSGGKKISPTSGVFMDSYNNNNYFFSKCTLLPRGEATILLFYEVYDNTAIENCRLIYGKQAIELQSRI